MSARPSLATKRIFDSEYKSRVLSFPRRLLAHLRIEKNNSWTLHMKSIQSVSPVQAMCKISDPFTQATSYTRFIFCVVAIDIIRILIEADMVAKAEYITDDPAYYYIQVIKLLCFSVYVLDLIIRVSAQLDTFFTNVWNLVDLFVFCDYIAVFVIYCTFPYFRTNVGLRILRGLQVLRIFKFISLVPSLELVVNALLYTMSTAVLDVLILTIMAIFVLGVFGYYLFGISTTDSEAHPHWSSLPTAFYTVWVYLCGDNWLPYEDELRVSGYSGSQAFSMLLIFVGNFIIFNSFIGVISQNVYEASQAERIQILVQQKEAKLQKKELFLKKQQNDILQLVQQKTLNSGARFQDIIRGLAGTLRHDDHVLVKQLPMNLLWLEAFVLGLHYHENAMYRCQQAHFAIAHSLAEIVDKRSKEV